jgi:hypothetical protein
MPFPSLRNPTLSFPLFPTCEDVFSGPTALSAISKEKGKYQVLTYGIGIAEKRNDFSC